MRVQKHESKGDNVKEVQIVKKITRMDSEQYISVHLKSSDNNIADLMQKAIDATNTDERDVTRNNPGIL